MDKVKLVLTVGLPASGKTEWSKAWVAQDSSSRLRVSRKDIRRMLGPSIITNSRESLISTIESTAVRNALFKGYSIVLDHYNLNPVVRAKWESYVPIFNSKSEDFQLELEYVKFNKPLEDCIILDSKRKGDQCVGEKFIRTLYTRYLTDLDIPGTVATDIPGMTDEDMILVEVTKSLEDWS